jgi:hypothetical protein
VHSILPISEKEAKRVKSARILLENDLRKETKSLEASISKITTMLQEVKQVDFVIFYGNFPNQQFCKKFNCQIKVKGEPYMSGQAISEISEAKKLIEKHMH